MAYKNYQACLGSVLPIMRRRNDIVKDIGKTDLDSNESKKKIAEIELHIKDGDAFYKKRDYQAALTEFKTARALIYSLIYPTFDTGAYIISEYTHLPVSKEIENVVLKVSKDVIDLIIPEYKNPVTFPKLDGDDYLTNLEKYFETGFREQVSLEEKLENVCNQGIELQNEGKYKEAGQLFESALNYIDASGAKVNEASLGALQLNYSAALLQEGNFEKALEVAAASQKTFASIKDNVGQAQALHIQGISSMNKGDADGAAKLLNQAANLYKQTTAVFNLKASDIKKTRVAKVVENENVILNTAQATAIGDTDILMPITSMDTKKVTYRIPGEAGVSGTLTIPAEVQEKQQTRVWNVGVYAGQRMVYFQTGNKVSVSPSQIREKLYEIRVSKNNYKDLEVILPNTESTAFYLTHLYAFSLPVKIGDCFHELGQYSKAEESYILAAKYSYLNKNIEATMLWNRMALNAVEWGHSLYKNEDIEQAKAQYSKVITETGTVPASYLYTTASLSVPANMAKSLIANIVVRPLPEIDWEIAMNVLNASCYLQQIYLGLDFYGLMLSPIHTFEYLQSIAKGFADEAIQAEREFINFKTHEEMEAATRKDLETTKAMANAEVDCAYQQYLSAKDDEDAAKAAYDLAVKRYTDAINERNKYAATSWDQLWAQAASQALGGKEDALWSEICALADKLDRGETIHGPGPKLAAAQTLSAGRKSRQYELDKMQNNIDQLNQAKTVAYEQWQSARHRTKLCEIKWQEAQKRAELADNAIDAFDNEFFTPDSWSKMANIMRGISREYLSRAIRIAKLMERAYNFENDTQIKTIKNEYGVHSANYAPGRDTILFGGDSLLKDIDSFTYHAITTKIRKSSRIKDVISVATYFPSQFEKFRQTGVLNIETDLYEFDRMHPGFYCQRIEAVEVEVVGILPEEGLNGTLSAGGVTTFRLNGFSDATTPKVGKRVHQVDTMALSSYVMRNDIYIYGAETGVRGLFQGFGIGTSWQLHLPKRSNNFDYRRIFDVRLVIYYTAKFDALLRTKILSLPVRNGEMSMLKNYGLRYDFPDAWYSIYKTGTVNIALDKYKLPFNQTNFKINSVAFRVVPKNDISTKNISLEITGPNGVPAVLKTDDNGVVSIQSGADSAGMIGKTPLGNWKIKVIDGESITEGGVLKYDNIYNIQMGLEYSFENVSEEVI